jgi:hypothetical protein
MIDTICTVCKYFIDDDLKLLNIYFVAFNYVSKNTTFGKHEAYDLIVKSIGAFVLYNAVSYYHDRFRYYCFVPYMGLALLLSTRIRFFKKKDIEHKPRSSIFNFYCV